jgi:hypothetical protein
VKVMEPVTPAVPVSTHTAFGMVAEERRRRRRRKRGGDDACTTRHRRRGRAVDRPKVARCHFPRLLPARRRAALARLRTPPRGVPTRRTPPRRPVRRAGRPPGASRAPERHTHTQLPFGRLRRCAARAARRRRHVVLLPHEVHRHRRHRCARACACAVRVLPNTRR